MRQGKRQNAPSHPRREIDGLGPHDGLVHGLGASCDVRPVVEPLDACVGFEGVVCASGDDVDGFGECAEEVWCGAVWAWVWRGER